MAAESTGAMPPASRSFEELLADVMGDDTMAALRAVSDAHRLGYAQTIVLDHVPACMRGELPRAWSFIAFCRHVSNTDGIARKRRHDHTPETCTPGSLDDPAYGSVLGRGAE